MRFIWITALKDWRRQRRNLAELLLYIGIPVFIGGIIVLAFGGAGGGPTPQAHLLVADEDDTFLSSFLIGALSQDDTGAPIRAEKVTSSAGRRRIDDGDGTALLVIPAGFSDAVLNETATTLKLWVNPAQRILPKIVEESLSLLAEGVFYLHRVFGTEIKIIAQGIPPGQNTFDDLQIGALAMGINQRVATLVDRLDPLAIDIEIVEKNPGETEATEADVTPGGRGVLFLPGILVMSMLFMSQGLGNDIWLEREQHTLRRVVVAPRRLLGFLAGKSLAATAPIFLVCLVGLGVGYAYLGLSIGTMPLAVIWATCTGVMLLALMTTVQVGAQSQRAGQISSMILIFPLMMLGGSFFPFEAMPSWMVAVGQFTPNGWALQLLKEIIRGERGVTDMAGPVLILIAVVVVFFALAAAPNTAFRPEVSGLRDVFFILRKDLKYMLREKETILWVFLLPLLFFWFIGTVTGGFSGGGDRATKVAFYAPLDAGHLADRLEERLTAGDFAVIRRDTLPPDDITGPWIALPAAMTDSVVAGRPVVIRFHPSGESDDRQYQEFGVGRAIYSLLADLVVIDQGGGVPSPAAFDSLKALPRPLQIETAPAGERLEIPTGMQQSVPGIMVMFTLLIMTTSGAVLLVIERRQGLLRRLAATPISRLNVVLGKWGAKFVLGLIQITYAMAMSLLPPFNMDWGASVQAVIAVMFWYGAFMAAVGMLLGTLARSEGIAVAIGVISSNVLGALGGCWWPIEVTPPWLQKFALFLPTGWAMDALHRVVSFGASPYAVLPHIVGMAFGTAALLWLAARLFRYD